MLEPETPHDQTHYAGSLLQSLSFRGESEAEKQLRMQVKRLPSINKREYTHTNKHNTDTYIHIHIHVNIHMSLNTYTHTHKSTQTHKYTFFHMVHLLFDLTAVSLEIVT